MGIPARAWLADGPISRRRRRGGGVDNRPAGFLGSCLRLLARRFDLHGGACPDSARLAAAAAPFARRPGPVASERQQPSDADVEMRRERNAARTAARATAVDDRKHATPQRRNRNPSPRFWLLRALPSPWAATAQRPDSYVYARTPRPTRSRVTVAGGRSPGSRVAAFGHLPRILRSQWSCRSKLAAYSCGGSRGMDVPSHAHRVPF